MIYFITFCLSALRTIHGDICKSQPLETCQELLYSSNLFSIQGFPNVEQIKRLCPSAAAYLKCLEEYKNACDFDEFGIFSSNEEFIKVQDFITDICDFNSSLHKEYVEHQECLVSFKEITKDCDQEADSVFHQYTEYKNNLALERDQLFIRSNPICVSKGYKVICLVMKILDTCGEKSHDLSLMLIQRSNLLQHFCKRMELYDIQINFVGFLKLDNDQRDRISAIFTV